jgi:hypothetical protein
MVSLTVLVGVRVAQSFIFCVVFCRSLFDCLIKELGIDNYLGNPAYTPTTLSKEEIVDNRVCFLFLCQALEFQPKMGWCIYCHSTGFLNDTSVFINTVLLLCLPNVPQNLFPNYYINIYSIRGQKRASEVVWIRCGVWRSFRVHTIKGLFMK